MNESPREQFNELSFYTLGHQDKTYFIHQHVVDAFQAQRADEHTKPIGLIFALIGLYLYLEKGYTGREVQLVHMKLAENKKQWQILELPIQRGAITVSDVLMAEPGKARDQIIKKWCSSVWTAYQNWHEGIATLARTELKINGK